MTLLPTSRLLLLAVLGVPVATLPLFAGANTALPVFVMWLVFAVVAASEFGWLLIARPSLAAEVPAVVGVGDENALRFSMSVRGVLPLDCSIRSETDGPIVAGEDAKLRVTRARHEYALPFRAPRRGTGAVVALWSRLRSPLGFAQRIDRVPIEDGVIKVIPSTRRVKELALAHFGARLLSGGSKIDRRSGEGGEFDAMDGYVPGMDLRLVDWKSSARHQDLRVRKYRLEKNQRLYICVDVGRLMGDPIAGVQRLDHAIHATMLLSQTALRAGDLVGLHGYGAQPSHWLPPKGGMRQASRIHHVCAAMQSRAEETNHALGIRSLLERLKRRSLVVVFTDFVDSTTAELMVENLGQLVRRHLVVFVALDDPSLERPLSSVPQSSEDLASGVIAAHLKTDRLRVLRRLSRSGVDVVSGAPGQATLRLLTRYVDIKRRGGIG